MTRPRAPRQPVTWRRALLWVLLYGIVPVLIVSSTMGFMRFKEFVDRDPRFCGQCHEMRSEYALWTRGSHRMVVCQECHHQSQREALGAVLMVLGGRSADDGTKAHQPKVAVDACGACHLRHDRNWPQINASEGHRVHVVQEKTSCVKCHANSMHGVGIALDSCRECHEKQVIQATGMERLHCLSCHNFLTAEKDIKAPQENCLQCHGAREQLEEHFPSNAPMAKRDCSACHHPHTDEDTGWSSCAGCHKQQDRHGLHGLPDHQRCDACHRPHTWMSTRADCVACHKEEADKEPERQCRECHNFMPERRGPDAGAEAP
ncbi:MAG: cytochrome c3 family protein [Deltaproteobacteria bacterium]|nr:cytochrome c3 family protein [Deltaproteobacteria bacterium]